MISLTLYLCGGWLVFELAVKGCGLNGVDLRDHMGPGTGLTLIMIWPAVLVIALIGRNR